MRIFSVWFFGLSVWSASVNMTVYRVTPRNYTGLTNLDTGDAAGDAFFGLYEMSAPVICEGPGADQNLLCRNEPILQIPGFNVYTSSVIEIDPRFGDYSECNPNPNTGVFNCTHFSKRCWYKNPQFVKDFGSLCSKNECNCDVVEKQSVGREFPKFGSQTPPGTPAVCADDFFVFEFFKFRSIGKPYRTVKTDLAGCCSTCAADNAHNSTTCALYEFTLGQCSLFSTQPTSFNVTAAPLTKAGVWMQDSPALWLQHAIGQLSDRMNGIGFRLEKKGSANLAKFLVMAAAGGALWNRLETSIPAASTIT
eukprot:CAMPEP_0175124088 /NCGR_PEP_ID=MMETSP0087-20121206/2590_1 /TAXON_ID=136419 /ORGANISM="Unknown Unknown, Strain D1" /LENGTH=307 /DNA_ID=CAMNT_0016405823 /DNA_START=30 /DNA_END=957 /DNA_ORIENTATION=+